MYVVTGANGQTGRATVDALLRRGERVRAVVRSAERAKAIAQPGVEVVVADIQDGASLSRALEGADGVYLVRPPATRVGGVPTARAFREAVSRTTVDRVVVLSAIGAQHATGHGVVGGLHDLENDVRQAGRPVIFLRAASFLENWLGMIGAVKAQGVLPSLLPADFAFAQVAAADIGTEVARLLVDGSGGREIVNVSGPVDPSANDIARAVGRKLETSVPVFHIPVEAQQAQLEAAGVPGPYAKEVVELYVGILDGTVRWPDDEPVVRGSTTPEAWLDASI